MLDAEIFVCFTRGQPSFLSSYSSHFLPTGLFLHVITHNMAHSHLVGLPWTSDQRVVQASNYTRHKNIHASRGIFLFVLSFLLSVNSIHCVPSHPLSPCHLFLCNTQHKHPCPQRDSNPQTLAFDRAVTGISWGLASLQALAYNRVFNSLNIKQVALASTRSNKSSNSILTLWHTLS